MADEARVLLLDLDPVHGLGTDLQHILLSSRQFSIRLKIESRAPGMTDLAHNGLSRSVRSFLPDAVFLVLTSSDLLMTDAVSRLISVTLSDLPVIVAVERAEPDQVMTLLRTGVIDCLTPPLKPVDILPRLWRLLEENRRNRSLTRTLKEQLGLKQLVGQSPRFLSEMRKIPIVACGDASVIISGETGTGKELVARAIHYLSHRSTKPFITVNCGAIPAELVENELFGHAPGAFTGANSVQQGVVEEADGGTLFLDEIDCLPIASQVKLLRFLQEHEYKRLGSTKVCHADLRIIAATNIELEKAVQEGRFRRDLYYRLNVVPIALPPLRERKEDIPTLARHFLEKYVYEFGKKMSDFSREAIGLMLAYKWPGNVRELENAVERAVIFAKGPVIEHDDIVLPYAVTETPDTASFKKAKAKAISQFERHYIEDLLLVNQGNIAKAARAAQKNRRAFWELIRRHGIDVEAFRRAAEGPMVEQPQRMD